MATEAQCKEALREHTQRLLTLPNVEGLGVREIEKPGETTDQTELCVAIYVRKKVAAERLAPQDVVPEYIEIRRHEGAAAVRVPTAVFEIGELKFGQSSVED